MYFDILFWNVHGLSQRDGSANKKFKYISNFDIFALVETWLTEDQMYIVPEFIEENYILFHEPAIEGSRRNSGGILMGVRKYLNIDYMEFTAISRDISVLRLGIEENYWQFVTVYSRQGRFIRDLYEPLERIIEDSGHDQVMIMGDFNIRIGTADGNVSEDTSRSGYKRLIQFKNDHSLTFLNGKLSDSRGKCTRRSVNNRNTVIDYMLVKKQYFCHVHNFQVQDSIALSDHLPLCATINTLDLESSTTSDEKDETCTSSDEEDETCTSSDEEDETCTSSDEEANNNSRTSNEENFFRGLGIFCSAALTVTLTVAAIFAK